EARGLRLQAARLRAGALRLLARLPRVLAGLVGEHLAAPAAVAGVEEVGDRSSDRSCEDEKRHLEISLVEDSPRSATRPRRSETPSTYGRAGSSQIRGKSTDFPRAVSRPSRSRASESRGRRPHAARRLPPAPRRLLLAI